MPKRKRSCREAAACDQPGDVRVLDYEITTEPIQNRQYRKLPLHVKEKDGRHEQRQEL